jgi:hypothetical protein
MDISTATVDAERVYFNGDGNPDDEIFHNGQRLLWADSLKEEPHRSHYKIRASSVQRWETSGPFILGGKKPGLVRLWFHGRPRPRLYVPIAWLDEYKKARDGAERDEASLVRDGWVSIEKAAEMGFPIEFTRRYTNYEIPGRDPTVRVKLPPRRKAGDAEIRRRSIREPHPHLKRFIRSENFMVRARRRPFVWGADLEAIMNAPAPDPIVWVDQAGLIRMGIGPEVIIGYENRPLRRLDGQMLETCYFWGKGGKGWRMVKHWRTPHVEKIAADLERTDDYERTEPDGTKYVPVIRAAKLVGMKTTIFYSYLDRPVPEWNNLIIHSRKFRVKLHRVKQEEPIFVNYADVFAVYRFLHPGEAPPEASGGKVGPVAVDRFIGEADARIRAIESQSAQPAKRRGSPGLSREAREHRIDVLTRGEPFARTEAGLKGFCCDEGITYETYRGWQSWYITARNRESAK